MGEDICTPMSKTLKGMLFYPACKLKSYPVSFMDVGREHETPDSEMMDSSLHTIIAAKSNKV